ncbi:hypothetical protein GCM10022402_38160 [Salinactinospora qingdaonensis]|uniref:Thymidylate kinase n=1 Tax=Salinactinospora qingdaonensis TaxID=702744 RepID=A0ABP7G5Y2_9ACTN
MLASKPFRRLWISLSLSSLGDWLSLLALVSLAALLTRDQPPLTISAAVGGVIALKLAPWLVLSPLANALAGRVDRRITMVVADLLRAALYVSVPLVGRLDWLLVATFVAECAALFWAPTKEAATPSLVPKRWLGQADQLNLLTTYGSALAAAALFAVVTSTATVLAGLFPPMSIPDADIALYIAALLSLAAAVVVWTLPLAKEHGEQRRAVSLPRALWSGWRGGTVRRLSVGMLGALAAAGAVIGVARLFVPTVGAGNAGFGVLVGAVFTGVVAGVLIGPRVLRDFSRRRLFGLSVGMAGAALLLAGLIPNMVFAAGAVTAVGIGAGLAWATGVTLLDREVADHDRAGAFGFVYAAARVALMGVAAVAAVAAGLVGSYTLPLGELTYDFSGAAAVLLIMAVLTLVLALVCYRRMNREPADVSLAVELWAALRGVPVKRGGDEEATPVPGTFIVVEGGEGAGKSTQVRQLSIWLRDEGFDVVTTREPGATKLGTRLRALLLDKEHTGMSSRAEALLYAADRAEHVNSVIRPALQRGAIVISDRFVDSTLAYQGAGREMAESEIVEINRWATEGLVPHLTVLLDVPAAAGLARHASPTDRIEAEAAEFHERVCQGFRDLAEREPQRYLVLDAQESPEEITRAIQRRIRPILPDPVPDDSEAVTNMIPVIRE